MENLCPPSVLWETLFCFLRKVSAKDTLVAKCHSLKTEECFRALPGGETTNISYFFNSGRHLLRGFYDESRFAILNDFPYRADIKTDNRGSARHCLNHDQAKNFVILRGKKKCLCLLHESNFLFHIRLA